MIRQLVFGGGNGGMFEGACALALRLGLGGIMLWAHGWGKLMAFNTRSAGFPDPLGLGSPTSMAMAVFAEVGCSILIMLGLATRVALIPLIITMAVAFFIVHHGDPWQKKELAAVYAISFVALWFLGAGRYSLDHRLGR